MNLGARPLMAVGHTVQRAGACREDTLVEVHPSERRDPWGHDPFAARLVSWKPGAIQEDDVVAQSGEEERGCRAARPGAHDDRIGLDHRRTLAE
jgi:hypothetical protein